MLESFANWLLVLLGVALGWVLARRAPTLLDAAPPLATTEQLGGLITQLAGDDPDRALAALTQAAEMDHSMAELHLTLGSLFRKRGEVDRALRVHEALLARTNLKPELRDQTISQGVEQAARHAHDSYRRVIANGDMRLQLFLAKHTSHLEDIPAATPMTKVKLDWDAQKWKAPVYLMEDRAFDGVVGIGTAAAGGTIEGRSTLHRGTRGD